jgi:periplasmic copper chaperone A
MIEAWLELRRLAVIGSALVGAALVTVALASAGESLQAENAWVPWAPPGLKVHVAYMTIVNRGATDQIIVSVESTDYERIELHRSVIKDGVSTMEAIGEVKVPANGRVEFAPTGLHLMLIGPRRPQALDGHVQIVLRLSSGEQVDVSALIRRRDDAGHGAHSHH